MDKYDYIVIGAGAAGIQFLNKACQESFFQSKQILLIEKNLKPQNKMWSFWEKEETFPSQYYEKKWSQARVGKFGGDVYSLFPYRYCTIDSKKFIVESLQEIEGYENITIVQESVQDVVVKEQTVITDCNSYFGDFVLDSRVSRSINLKPHHIWLKQHFVGVTIETKNPVFDKGIVDFMDFSVEQKGNTRFMYVLPFSENRALFEYTLFSSQELSYGEYKSEVINYIEKKLGVEEYNILEEEQGVIPMTNYPFEEGNTCNYIKIGTAGGWTRSSTGFTFKNIQRKTDLLIEQLKRGNVNSKLLISQKYRLYDTLLLDILNHKNYLGADIFTSLFKRNKTENILDFLDETSTIKQDLRIIVSSPAIVYIKAILNQLRLRFIS